MQLTSINYNSISDENGDEDEVKYAETADLFAPEILLKAQSVLDISIK